MNATVELANQFRQRYAMVVNGAYLIFEVLDPGVLQIGDRVTGNLESFGLQVWDTQRLGRIRVKVEDFHRSRPSADAWVNGR